MSRNIISSLLKSVILAMVVTFSFVTPSMSQINMSASGSHSQNFDALISTGTGTWTSNSTIPSWYSQRTGNGSTISAGTGSSNAGSLSSFGATGSTERALGTVGSGNAAIGNMAHGVQLRNTSGNTITDIKVSYTLEQWRCGGPTSLSQLIHGYYKISTSRIDTLHPPDTSYSTTLINNNAVYGWTQIPGLTLGSLINATAAAALDGNLPANRVGVVNIALPGLSLANNEFIMIKWDDSNHVGSDHGLALDDVAVSWTVNANVPGISATNLAGFGDVCLGTTAGPNIFSVSGNSLNNTSIVVGPLAGYSFSTTAGGTYTSTLTIPQAGGTLATTQVYVKFSPNAAQTYNGNIPLTGGGAPSINVATSGTGSTGVTPTFTAIAPICIGGNFSLPTTSNNGITGLWTPAVNTNANTTYTFNPNAGQCGSTTTITVVVNTPVAPNFTPIAAICSGSNFTLPVTSNNGIAGTWTPAFNNMSATTYTFAPNAGSCATSTTLTVNVNPSVTPSFDAIAPICAGSTFTIPITSNNGISGTWAPALNNLATTTYTFTPTPPANCANSTNITVVVLPNTAEVITGDSSAITTNTAMLRGSIGASGCGNALSYGITYSGINGFIPGNGTRVQATNLQGNNFSTSLTNLVQNTAYYYRAYAVTASGTVYGEQKFFATLAIPTGLTIYGNPSYRGLELYYSVSGIKPGHYAVRLINSAGQLVFQKDIIVQVNFIDDRFVIPSKLPIGLYVLQVVNSEFKIQKPMYIQ